MQLGIDFARFVDVPRMYELSPLYDAIRRIHFRESEEGQLSRIRHRFERNQKIATWPTVQP